MDLMTDWNVTKIQGVLRLPSGGLFTLLKENVTTLRVPLFIAKNFPNIVRLGISKRIVENVL